MMFRKIKEIKPLEEYRLLAVFDNGEIKTYDVKPLFEKWEAFQALRTIPYLFDQVHIDAGGYGISWNDEVDLSCDEIYYNGVAVSGVSGF